MNRVFALVACILALGLWPSPGVAWSADKPIPSFKWWKSDEVVKELRLTPEQSSKIESIFQGCRDTLIAGKTDLERLEAELSQLMADSAAEERDVAAKVDQVETARAALSKTRTMMLYRIHRILTSEQRERLKALHERHVQQGRHPDHPFPL